LYIVSASKIWSTDIFGPQQTQISAQIIQQALLITAALPQVLITGALYLFLGMTGLVVTFRTPRAPFTLAGLLMMHRKLTNILPGVDLGDYKAGERSDSSSQQDI
jgi:hypothetical protein